MVSKEKLFNIFSQIFAIATNIIQQFEQNAYG